MTTSAIPTNIPAVREDAHQMETKTKHIVQGIVSYIWYSIKCYKSYGCYFTYHCNLLGKNRSGVRKVPDYGCGVGVSMGVVHEGEHSSDARE